METYDKYKPSGVDWIGDIPEHWEVKKSKYVTRLIIDGTHVTPTYLEEGVPFLRVTDIQTAKINLNEVRRISEAEHKELTKRCKPEKGDLLLSKNGTIGITKVVTWDWEFSIFVSLCLIKFREVLNPYFFSYMFSSDATEQQLSEESKTTSVTNLHLEKIKELLVILPPLSEQTAIADYLDEKVGQINSLISSKLRLIELLKEERTAIINQAVTRGINPHAKLKLSGIAWLGDIPEHWEVKKLKYLVELVDEVIESSSFVIAVENIEGRTGRIVNLDEEKTYQGAINGFKKGDVLFNKLRPYLTKVYFAEQEGGFIGELLNLRSSEEIYSKFLYYRVLSATFIDVVDSSTTGTKMPRASWDGFINQLLIPFPLVEEQKQIVEFIENATNKIDATIAKIEKEIGFVREYRTALISEVVTGKIRVV